LGFRSCQRLLKIIQPNLTDETVCVAASENGRLDATSTNSRVVDQFDRCSR